MQVVKSDATNKVAVVIVSAGANFRVRNILSSYPSSSSSWTEVSDPLPFCSVSPTFTEIPGTRYSSLVHLSKSISLHRSEQNGRHGLSLYSTDFPHVGQFRMVQTYEGRIQK